MGESHKSQKERSRSQLQTSVLVNWPRSPLTLFNKLLVYKCIIKPIWSYGIQLWGSASNSNLEILQRFQNNVLRAISNAPWFTKNVEIHEYLNMPTIKEVVNKYSTKYKERLQKHTNQLARDLVRRTLGWWRP